MRESTCSITNSLIGSRMHSGIRLHAACAISIGSCSRSAATEITVPATSAMRCRQGERKSKARRISPNSPSIFSDAQPSSFVTAVSSQLSCEASAETMELARSCVMKFVTLSERLVRVVLSQIPAATRAARIVTITSSTEGMIAATASRFSATLPPSSISSSVPSISSLKLAMSSPSVRMKAGGISSSTNSTASFTGSQTGRVCARTQSQASLALSLNQPMMPDRLSP